MGPAGPAHYCHASPRVPLVAEIGAWAADLMASGRPVVEAALELARRIKGEFAYVSGATHAAKLVAEAVAARPGVCHVFAHWMWAGLRWVGLPSHHVRVVCPPHSPPAHALVGRRGRL